MNQYKKYAKKLWNNYKNDQDSISGFIDLGDHQLTLNVYGFNIVVKLHSCWDEIEELNCYANDKIHPTTQIEEFLRKHLIL